MICTVCTNGYAEYARVMLYSLALNGKTNDLVKVFSFDKVNVLDEKYHNEFRNLYKNIEFETASYDFYVQNNKDQGHFLALESYRQTADRVLFLDSDLLILGDINPLLENKSDIAMVYEKTRPCYNSGVVVIGKKYRNENIYTALMRHQKKPETFGRDQAVLNEFFKGRIDKLDNKYNSFNIHGDHHAVIQHFIVKAWAQDIKDRVPKWLIDLYFDYMARTKKICGVV